VLCRPCRH